MISAQRLGRRSLVLGAAPVASVLTALAFALPAAEAAPKQPPSYAVASESAAATREASKLLEAGGNAIDAAVCAALVAGITSPSSSGIGGGGFALVWSARDRTARVLDFRETAPAAVDAALLEQRPLPEAKRGQSVGVPGEIAGLFELHQRYGKTPWPDVVGRAARIASQGFAAEPHTAEQLEGQKASPIARSATFKATYLPRGEPAKTGTSLRASKLAATLRLLAAQGKRAYYEGRVARDIVSTVAAAGGGMTLADLSAYKPVDREPLRVAWEGKEVLTMPPPSAGGMLLAQTLSLFSKAELAALASTPAKRIHLLAEAMRGSFADRARYLGDPALTSVDMAKLLAPGRMRARKALLAEDRTHTQPRFGLEESGTHHLVTADQEGNWVTLTTTVNGPFGAKLMAEQSGIILNNQLEDFTPSASLAVFGALQNPNAARPGARPTSSMAPTLVLDAGAPVLALGGSGGTAIAPIVAQALLLRLVDGASPEVAVSAPRFSIPAPSSGQTLTLETLLAKAFGSDLEQRGELWRSRDSKAAVQMIAREDGVFLAGADPRKQGLARSQSSVAAPAPGVAVQ
ncbi:MAG TPA: gamma-glutamyltransferase [Polyangiaceae bacterium]